MTAYEILSLFLVYAFLGWCAEVIYAAVTTGRIINRGFLNGPVCPIYGVGMIGVLTLLAPFSDNTPALFITGLLLCSLIELVGGWALKQFFHTRWWDYSMRPMNIGGYVCLGFSIVWGLAVVFVVDLVHPVILTGIRIVHENLHPALFRGLLCLLYLVFIADLVMTLITIIGLQKKLDELEKIAGALHNVSDGMSEAIGRRAIAADARFDELKASTEAKLESDRQEVLEGAAYLEEQIRRLEEAIAVKKRRIAEAAAESRERAEEALAERRDQAAEALAEGRERIAATLEERREKQELQRQERQESLEEMEERLQQLRQRLSENRRSMRERAPRTVRDLPGPGRERPERLRALEARRQELLQSIDASRFGTRRLTGAFPALQHALQERVARTALPGEHRPTPEEDPQQRHHEQQEALRHREEQARMDRQARKNRKNRKNQKKHR